MGGRFLNEHWGLFPEKGRMDTGKTNIKCGYPQQKGPYLYCRIACRKGVECTFVELDIPGPWLKAQILIEL